MGLIIHQFHIRRREGGEEKKVQKKGKGRADEYAAWCVHCDVCGDYSSLVPPAQTHHPLYYFQNRHLGQQIHLANGQRILSSMEAVEEVVTFDDAAATAAAVLALQPHLSQQLQRTPPAALRYPLVPTLPLRWMKALALLVGSNFGSAVW